MIKQMRLLFETIEKLNINIRPMKPEIELRLLLEKLINAFKNKEHIIQTVIEFIAYLKAFSNDSEIFRKCIQIVEKKNSDYANSSDPFRNFRFVEELGICSVETGIVVRLCDKIARICNLLHKEPNVKNETLYDSILDAINYIAILYSYWLLEKTNKIPLLKTKYKNLIEQLLYVTPYDDLIEYVVKQDSNYLHIIVNEKGDIVRIFEADKPIM